MADKKKPAQSTGKQKTIIGRESMKILITQGLVRIGVFYVFWLAKQDNKISFSH